MFGSVLHSLFTVSPALTGWCLLPHCQPGWCPSHAVMFVSSLTRPRAPRTGSQCGPALLCSCLAVSSAPWHLVCPHSSPWCHQGSTGVTPVSSPGWAQCGVSCNCKQRTHSHWCGHPWPAPAHSWPYRGAGVTPVVMLDPIRTPVLSQPANQSPAQGLHKTLHITEIAHQRPDTSLIPWQNTNYHKQIDFFICISRVIDW